MDRIRKAAVGGSLSPHNANYLSSVNDGAAWIWNIVRMCYGNCVEIIDWWHAVEKLWQIAQHHFDAESEQTEAMGSASKTAVDGLAASHDILRNMRLLYPRGHLLPDPVRKAMLYLFHNRWRMRYPSSVLPVTPSAAASSNRPASMSSSSALNNLVCAGRVSALKPCSLCAQLYLASPTSSLELLGLA